jgi:hypothetical protein
MENFKYLYQGNPQTLDIENLGLIGRIRLLRDVPKNIFGSPEKNPETFDYPTTSVLYPVGEQEGAEFAGHHLSAISAKVPHAESHFDYLPEIKRQIDPLIDFPQAVEVDDAHNYKHEFAQAKTLFCLMCYICLRGQKVVKDEQDQEQLVDAKAHKTILDETNLILNRLTGIKAYEEALEFMEISYRALIHFESDYLHLFEDMKKNHQGTEAFTFNYFAHNTVEGKEYIELRKNIYELEQKCLELRRLSARKEIPNAREVSLGKAGFIESPSTGIGIYNVEDCTTVLLRCKKDVYQGDKLTATKGAKAAYFISSPSSPEDNIFLDRQLDGFLKTFKDKHPGLTNDDIEISIVGGKSTTPRGLEIHAGYCRNVADILSRMSNDLSQIERYEGNNFGGRRLNDALQNIRAGLQYVAKHGFYDFTESFKELDTQIKELCPKLQVAQTPDKVNLEKAITDKNRAISQALQNQLKELNSVFNNIPKNENAMAAVLGNGAIVIGEVIDFVTRNNLTIHSTCIANPAMPDNFVFKESEKGNLTAVRGCAATKREDWRAARVHGLMGLDNGLCDIEFGSSTAPYTPLFISRNKSNLAHGALTTHQLIIAKYLLNLGARYSDLPEINKGLEDLGVMILGVHGGYFRYKSDGKDKSLISERLMQIITVEGVERQQKSGLLILPKELTRDIEVNVDEQILGPTLLTGVEGSDKINLRFCYFVTDPQGSSYDDKVRNLNKPITDCLSSDKPGAAFINVSRGRPEKVTITIEAPKEAPVSLLDRAGNQPSAAARIFTPGKPVGISSFTTGGLGLGLSPKTSASPSISGKPVAGLQIDFKTIAANAAKSASAKDNKPSPAPAQTGPKTKDVTIRPLTFSGDHRALQAAFSRVETAACLNYSLTPDRVENIGMGTGNLHTQQVAKR